MNKNLKVITLLAATSVGLSGCVAATIGTTAAVGTTIAQKRTAGRVVDDTTITAVINSKYVQRDVNMFSKVDVQVYEGRVLLTGNVQDRAHRVNATKLAWETAGVKEVINEVQVTSSRATAKTVAADTWITTQIKSKLLLEKGVKSVNYNVDTVNGAVYLIGVADNQNELYKVTEIARRIKGVKKVVNHVRLKSSPLRQAGT